MKKPEDAEMLMESGLFRGSEPMDNLHDRRTARPGDDDKSDGLLGDKGDDDTDDTDKGDTDSDDDTGDTDTRDTDGKD